MKKRLNLNESSGADSEIVRVAGEQAERIFDGFRDGRKFYTDNVTLHVTTPYPIDGRTEFEYGVEIEADEYGDLNVGGGDCENMVYGYLNFGYTAFKIRVNLRGKRWRSRSAKAVIADTLAHELMHTKTQLIGASIKRKDEEQGRVKNASEMLTQDMPEDGNASYPAYFLSPDEMASYTQGMYMYMRECVRDLVKAKGRKPTDRERREIFVKSWEWRRYKRALEDLDRLGYEEADEFLHSGELGVGISNGQAKKIMGVSSPDDLIRYLRKNAKDMELKLIKAAYRGYVDGLNKE